MSNPYKMEITQVGFVSKEGQLEWWGFDGHGKGIGIEYDAETGDTRYGGYTVEELREISRSTHGLAITEAGR